MKIFINNGYSLLELLIAIAIIGILSVIAYPSYTNAILKGRRAEARAALLDLLQQEERYMTQYNVYYAFTNTAGVTSPAHPPFKTFVGDSKVIYYLSAGLCPSTTISECVWLSAEPVTSDPYAGTLQISSTGTKTCTGSSSESICWK